MHCPMAESSGTTICDEDGAASMDCCEFRPAPEPVQASSLESVRPSSSLDTAELEPVARPHERRSQSVGRAPADSSRLHDLGRYTLFSSFLL